MLYALMLIYCTTFAAVALAMLVCCFILSPALGFIASYLALICLVARFG